MRFFTPELYARFNSQDDEVANEADAAWETATRAYKGYLDSIRDRLPSQVRKLAELCLHDAELLACDEAVEPLFPFPVEPFGAHPFWSAMAILSLKQDGNIVSVIYMLWDRIRESRPAPDWPFSKLRPCWSYDEVDLAPAPRGMFLHRVLLSDGRVLEIPFTSVIVHNLALSAPGGKDVVRQSA